MDELLITERVRQFSRDEWPNYTEFGEDMQSSSHRCRKCTF